MTVRLFRFALPAVAFLALAGSAAAGQDSQREALAAMRALDRRVATIGHRLAVANLDLCTDRRWLHGLAVHHLSQYGEPSRAAARAAFDLEAGPAVLALADGGPAARAGLLPDDVLLEADGEALPAGDQGRAGSFDTTEAVLDALDSALADGGAELRVQRQGETLSVRLEAERGCASRFQLIPSRKLNAHADGRYVQVTTAISAFVADDQELAWVLAHEFAHNVLRHRARLDAAGVARGFFGNFGRNARLIRDTEVEADRLSVYLLERAGYDPEASVRFCSRFGRRGLNFLGSATHPNWRRRIALFEEEIAAIRQARATGTAPLPAFLRAPSTTAR